ncbi:peptidase S9 [Hylemonella gracilis str. Niagara R]|uniref:Peptidase S9 n=1 Tax=Hylemonella gracilis str. Niagara R TaxID=1458275 RepID=A0A016XFZ4_9BURK|nr:S9 family peptidase [Hylemonella gracilis]EYC50108.1 peptidase S9 [Hylemonella gracilis str. Niagara R]
MNKSLALERFAALPLLSQVTLSPDGQKLAMLMNRGGSTYLVTRATASNDAPKALLHSDNKEYHFNWIRWVNNDRIVVSLRFASRRNFVGTIETRLLSIKAEGGEVVNLVRADSVSGSARRATIVRQIQDRVIDWLPTDDQHLLLALSNPGSEAPAVYKVNVNTGQRTIIKVPERHVQWWVTDAQGRVRAGVRHEDGTSEVRVASADGKEWRTLWTFSLGQDEVWPLGFGQDPNELYVLAAHEGRRAVFSVRLDDLSLKKTLRFAHPTQDVHGDLLRSPVTQEVIGLRRSPDDDESGQIRAELWEPIWRAQMQAIDAALPQRENLLIDISRDGQLYLISSESSRQPREFYMGDRRTGRVTLLGGTYPDLDVTLLAGKWRQRIKARDGLELDSFLSLPKDRAVGDGGAPLPLVLLPHGGPQIADDDDFDPWTAFLASRGYAVLQVNFRGSDGYGYNFRAAGLKRWGLEMQDDLADGVAWAVSQGVADPARVCIVGASYGGYAALMGVVKTPELYRCAVSFAGVSDLPDLIRHWGNYIGGDEWGEEQIGRFWGDRARLQATSPARQAEHIRVPVLLVHGTVDRAVPIEQSEAMVKALKRAGKPYRYIEQEGGDHYLSRYEHRLEFFTAMESFLDENLRATPSQLSTSR